MGQGQRRFVGGLGPLGPIGCASAMCTIWAFDLTLAQSTSSLRQG